MKKKSYVCANTLLYCVCWPKTAIRIQGQCSGTHLLNIMWYCVYFIQTHQTGKKLRVATHSQWQPCELLSSLAAYTLNSSHEQCPWFSLFHWSTSLKNSCPVIYKPLTQVLLFIVHLHSQRHLAWSFVLKGFKHDLLE